MSQQQAHVYIIGDVIGVGFRAWTKMHAQSSRIKGWIRNNFEDPDTFGPNGGVEAVFQGDKPKLDQMISLVKQGPSVSTVEDVEVVWEDVTKVYDGFEITK
jgi:acylphosphatase